MTPPLPATHGEAFTQSLLCASVAVPLYYYFLYIYIYHNTASDMHRVFVHTDAQREPKQKLKATAQASSTSALSLLPGRFRSWQRKQWSCLWKARERCCVTYSTYKKRTSERSLQRCGHTTRTAVCRRQQRGRTWASGAASPQHRVGCTRARIETSPPSPRSESTLHTAPDAERAFFVVVVVGGGRWGG